MIHHIKRATRHLIFWSIIASAISLTGVRLLLSGIDSYKSDVADHLSELMGGAPVKIGHIRAKMRGFNPELVLSQITIASVVTNEKPAIQLKEIRLGLNLLDALIGRDFLSSSWVTLVGAKLSVKRKQDGSFAVVGLKASDEQPLWLLRGGKYEVLQSEVVWQDEKNNGRPIKFAAVDVALINDSQRHRINMLVKLPKKYGNLIRVSMDLEGNVFEPSAIQGVVFAEGEKIQPMELLSSELPFNLKIGAGTGDFKIWSNWQHSQPISVKGSVKLQPLKLFRQDKGMLTINKLEARFNWRLSNVLTEAVSPWQLDVSHFILDTTDSGKNPNGTGSTGTFNMSAQSGNENLLPKIGVFVEHLDLQDAARLVQFFAPLKDEQAKLIKQTQLKGELEKFLIVCRFD